MADEQSIVRHQANATTNVGLIELLTAVKMLLDERDQRYQVKFTAADTALQVALTTRDKALDQSQLALNEYKSQANEWRGQSKDQTALYILRTEVQSMFKAYEEKLQTQSENFDEKLTTHNDEKQRELDAIKTDIRSLRETRSGERGKEQDSVARQTQANVIVGFVLVIILAVIQHFWK